MESASWGDKVYLSGVTVYLKTKNSKHLRQHDTTRKTQRINTTTKDRWNDDNKHETTKKSVGKEGREAVEMRSVMKRKTIQIVKRNNMKKKKKHGKLRAQDKAHTPSKLNK